MELFRVKKAARQSQEPTFPIKQGEPQFNIEIGFADEVVVTGEPVVEKLEEMHTHIEEILRLADLQLGTSTTWDVSQRVDPHQANKNDTKDELKNLVLITMPRMSYIKPFFEIWATSLMVWLI